MSDICLFRFEKGRSVRGDRLHGGEIRYRVTSYSPGFERRYSEQKERRKSGNLFSHEKGLRSESIAEPYVNPMKISDDLISVQ